MTQEHSRRYSSTSRRVLFSVLVEPGVRGGKPLIRCDWAPEMWAALEILESDRDAGKYADRLIDIAEELLAAEQEPEPHRTPGIIVPGDHPEVTEHDPESA